MDLAVEEGEEREEKDGRKKVRLVRTGPLKAFD